MAKQQEEIKINKNPNPTVDTVKEAQEIQMKESVVPMSQYEKLNKQYISLLRVVDTILNICGQDIDRMNDISTDVVTAASAIQGINKQFKQMVKGMEGSITQIKGGQLPDDSPQNQPNQQGK